MKSGIISSMISRLHENDTCEYVIRQGPGHQLDLNVLVRDLDMDSCHHVHNKLEVQEHIKFSFVYIYTMPFL